MVLIKELLPNPSGDDTLGEWIRLTNTGDAKIDLSGSSLKDSGGKIFGLDGVGGISPGEVIELSRLLTGIALNNDGDEVFLLDAQGKTIDHLSYSANITEGEIVTAESFIEEVPVRESLKENAIGFGRVDYQSTIAPIFIGMSIALVCSSLVWIVAKRED
ncbi:MAG: lamin tail domain-containing protein [Candidatus Colwellbacteria bacterium]|nr:lamin tail domain-containing protein [Candidatus Colwellbacteria bacterium]